MRMKFLLLLLLPLSVFAATPEMATLQKDIFFEGKVQQGSVRMLVRKGTELPVVSVNASTVTLQYNGIQSAVPKGDTDFEAREKELQELKDYQAKEKADLAEKAARAEAEKKEAFAKMQKTPPPFQIDPRTNHLIAPRKIHSRIADRLTDPSSLVIYDAKQKVVDYYGTPCWKLLMDIGAKNKMGGYVRQIIEVYWEPDSVLAVHFPN